jgi:hypothetical protein
MLSASAFGRVGTIGSLFMRRTLTCGFALSRSVRLQTFHMSPISLTFGGIDEGEWNLQQRFAQKGCESASARRVSRVDLRQPSTGAPAMSCSTQSSESCARKGKSPMPLPPPLETQSCDAPYPDRKRHPGTSQFGMATNT